MNEQTKEILAIGIELADMVQKASQLLLRLDKLGREMEEKAENETQ